MSPQGHPERFLSFRAGVVDYAISLEQVSGLADCGPIRGIEGTPPEVLGISEWRGRLLTVLDLPGLLGEPGGSGPMCLIRLSGVMARTALQVPAPVALTALNEEDREKHPFTLVDPGELVSMLEADILAGTRAGGD